MKSFALFSGNRPWAQLWRLRFRLVLVFFLLNFIAPTNAQAFHEDFANHQYQRPLLIATGAIASTYLISETHDGPALFAGIYSLGSLYLMNEWYKNEKDFTELIVPLGLLTLGVVNIALLRDRDVYSKNDIFIYNLAGLTLLSGYAIWEHAAKTAPHSSYTQVVPVVTEQYAGVVFNSRF